MTFASEDWHEKNRQYLQRHLNDVVIDNNGDHVIGANIAASGELTIYDHTTMTKKILAIPDLVLFNKLGEPEFVIEYKSGVNQRKKAVNQLQRAYSLVNGIWQNRPRLIYATGTPNKGFRLQEVYVK